jgi:hypothetical protein
MEFEDNDGSIAHVFLNTVLFMRKQQGRVPIDNPVVNAESLRVSFINILKEKGYLKKANIAKDLQKVAKDFKGRWSHYTPAYLTASSQFGLPLWLMRGGLNQIEDGPNYSDGVFSIDMAFGAGITLMTVIKASTAAGALEAAEQDIPRPAGLFREMVQALQKDPSGKTLLDWQVNQFNPSEVSKYGMEPYMFPEFLHVGARLARDIYNQAYPIAWRMRDQLSRQSSTELS